MKVSITAKRVVILLMTMALAVAMVACQAATPKPAEKGEQGDAGPTGPAGPAGTTDNDSPMFTAPEGMIYLAMAGTGRVTMSDKTDLSKYFKDTESPALAYKVKESSAPDVATAEVTGGKTLKVTAKKAGSATITVEAYDSVNDPVTGDFMVMVAASNTAPTVAATGTPATALGTATPGTTPATEASKLAKKLYISNGPQTVTVQSTIDAGLAVGVEDDVSFDTVVMGVKGADDDVVGVSVTKKPGTVGMWEVTLTPKKAGHQNVEVTVTDKFGAKADVKWAFQAVVNTVPMKVFDLPATMVLDKSVEVGTRGDSVIMIDRYFDTAEKSPTGITDVEADRTEAETTLLTNGEATVVPVADDITGVAHRDSTCVYSTNPDQTVDEAPTGDLADPATDQAGSGDAIVSGNDITVNIPIQKVGTFDLTIVCRDEEGSDHGTTKVTVRP